MLFDAEGGRGEYLADLREAFVSAIPGITGALNDLSMVCATLDRLDCRYSIQTTLVRNFEYYTGTVFDFHAAGCRMGSGGRYDGLIGLVGGQSVPASGFALSLSEIVSHLEVKPATAPRSPQLLIETRGATADVLAESFVAAERLRKLGRPAAVALPGLSVLPEDRLLSVEPRGGAFVYRLRDVTDGGTRDFDSLDGLVRALEMDRT